MSFFARILLAAFLTAFAVSTVAHAAGMTAMSVKMSLADTGDMNMADCEGCPSDDGDEATGTACGMVCTFPIVATVSEEKALPSVVADKPVLPGFLDGAGWGGPPEPYPPRPLG